MTIAQTILAELAQGPATLPEILPKAHKVGRYIEARKLESRGLITRVGTIRTKTMRGGLRRIVWKLT